MLFFHPNVNLERSVSCDRLCCEQSASLCSSLEAVTVATTRPSRAVTYMSLRGGKISLKDKQSRESRHILNGMF